MIRHLFKQLWNRKRSNGLLLIEIFISFIVVFALFSGIVSFALNANKPTGFSVENIYSVRLQTPAYDRKSEEAVEAFHTSTDLIEEVRQLEDVIDVASLFPYCYGGTTINTVSDFRDLKDIRSLYVEASDEIFDVMQVRILEGRGFEAGDDALDWNPAIISQAFVDKYCNGKSPIGEVVDVDMNLHAVGVIEDFRYKGDLSKRIPVVMARRSLSDYKKGSEPIRGLVIKVHPGTSAEFEEKVQKLVEGMAAGWTAQVNPMTRQREGHFEAAFAPFLVAGMIVGFLILMVILGMIGVFWLSITRRTEEIGIRRAMGGARRDIHFQFLGEIAVLTTLAVAAASLLIIQIPLLGFTEELPWSSTLVSLLVSATFMYLIAILSGLYPAWMAARIQPATALHSE